MQVPFSTAVFLVDFFPPGEKKFKINSNMQEKTHNLLVFQRLTFLNYARKCHFLIG